jgi:hypothetical protein
MRYNRRRGRDPCRGVNHHFIVKTIGSYSSCSLLSTIVACNHTKIHKIVIFYNDLVVLR